MKKFKAQAWYWFARALLISMLTACGAPLTIAPSCDGLELEQLEQTMPPPMCHVDGKDETQGAAWRAHPACAFNAAREPVPLDDPSVVESFGCDGIFWKREP